MCHNLYSMPVKLRLKADVRDLIFCGLGLSISARKWRSTPGVAWRAPWNRHGRAVEVR